VSLLKWAGLLLAALLLLLAAFFAYEPWRVHGGRFVTEYLLLAGAIALVGLLIAAATWYFAG